jgi:hypothetical protein
MHTLFRFAMPLQSLYAKYSQSGWSFITRESWSRGIGDALEREKKSSTYDHYLDLLLERPGAVLYARPLQQTSFPRIYSQFLDQCKHRPGGMKEFVRILLLHREFEQSLVEDALKEAWQKGMFQYDAVRQLLFSRKLPEHRMPQVTFSPSSHVPKIHVQSPNLKQYNALYQKRSVVH